MTRRRGKATPKSMRSPPRPPDIVKQANDVAAHHERRRCALEDAALAYERACRDPGQRQAHLDAFFALHGNKAVSRLVYDEEHRESRAYAREAGSNARPTDRLDGPAYMLDDLNVRREREWRYRTHRQRPIFVSPLAYLRSAPELENFIVDRMYARARELHGTPILPWRSGSRLAYGGGWGVASRIARDLTVHLDDQAYFLLSDAHALLSQLRGALARGIACTPTMQDLGRDVAGLAMALTHSIGKTRYADGILARAHDTITYRA